MFRHEYPPGTDSVSLEEALLQEHKDPGSLACRTVLLTHPQQTAEGDYMIVAVPAQNITNYLTKGFWEPPGWAWAPAATEEGPVSTEEAPRPKRRRKTKVAA